MDHCYVNKFNSSYIINLLYIYNMLIVGADMQKINKLKKQLSREFKIKDIGVSK